MFSHSVISQFIVMVLSLNGEVFFFWARFKWGICSETSNIKVHSTVLCYLFFERCTVLCYLLFNNFMSSNNFQSFAINQNRGERNLSDFLFTITRFFIVVLSCVF